jgi:hypothetical protein
MGAGAGRGGGGDRLLGVEEREDRERQHLARTVPCLSRSALTQRGPPYDLPAVVAVSGAEKDSRHKFAILKVFST